MCLPFLVNISTMAAMPAVGRLFIYWWGAKNSMFVSELVIFKNKGLEPLAESTILKLKEVLLCGWLQIQAGQRYEENLRPI